MNNYNRVEMPLPKVLSDNPNQVTELKESIYLFDKNWIVLLGWLKLGVKELKENLYLGLWCKFESKELHRFKYLSEYESHETLGYFMSDLPFYQTGYNCKVKIVFNPDKPNFSEPDLYTSKEVPNAYADQESGIDIDKYLDWMKGIQQGEIAEIIPRQI